MAHLNKQVAMRFSLNISVPTC